MTASNEDSVAIREWRGSVIRIRACLIPRFLWQTASIEVFVDDRSVLRTGGQLKLLGGASSTFQHLGSSHTLELSWGIGLPWSFPYTLSIDRTQVTKSRVCVQNWYINIISAIVVFFAIYFAVRL